MLQESSNRLTLYLSGLVFLAIISITVSTILLTVSSPRDIGALGVTLWFVGFFLAIFSVFTLIGYMWRRGRYPESSRREILLKRLTRSTILGSLFLTIALAMQSLRMLNLGDIVLFLMTLGIIELYFRTKAI